jgi:choline dehydrogenase-like flavoprotein
MTRILMDSSGRRISGIEYTTPRGAVEKVECKALVLACSAIETARQLLLNKAPEFPNGLANGNGQVGQNLTSHFGVTIIGHFPELRNRDASNDDGTDYYHSLLTGLYWDRPSPNFQGTYQVQCGSGLRPQLVVKNLPEFGSGLKRELREKNTAHVAMSMQGSLLISPKKFVDLDPSRKDAYGLNVSRVHLHYESNDISMAQDMVETCEAIISESRGEVLSTVSNITAEKLAIDSNHWVGTARMGPDPRIPPRRGRL